MTLRTKTDRTRRAAPTTGGKTKDTKKAQLIRLLSAKAGADVAVISGKFGWQPHTTRAAITALKKAGYEVTTQKPDPDKPTRYWIAAKPKSDGPAAATPKSAHAG